jgi:hypothetical protein
MTLEEFVSIRFLLRPYMVFAAVILSFGYFFYADDPVAQEPILWVGAASLALWLAYELALAMIRAECKRARARAEREPYDDGTDGPG